MECKTGVVWQQKMFIPQEPVLISLSFIFMAKKFQQDSLWTLYFIMFGYYLCLCTIYLVIHLTLWHHYSDIIANYNFALAHKYFLKDKPFSIKSPYQKWPYGICTCVLWYETERSALDVQLTVYYATQTSSKKDSQKWVLAITSSTRKVPQK